jgi:hypothetical protein
MEAGLRWNESTVGRDTATARWTRRLTAHGARNNTPTYHFNTAFTADSRFLVVVTVRGGRSAIVRAEVETGELTVLAATEGFGHAGGGGGWFWAPGPLGPGGYHATRTALAPASGWVIAAGPKRLHAVHVATGERRDLCAYEPGWRPSVPGADASGRRVYLPLSPVHPDFDPQHPGAPRRPYGQVMLERHGGIPTRIVQVDIDSGETRTVHEDPVAGCNHVCPSPTDDDLLLIDRDLPPTFSYHGDNGRSPRLHLLRLSTGRLTPLRPRNRHQFQSHGNFSRDGTEIFYHGPAYEGHVRPLRPDALLGEMFLGVSDLRGESVFEMNFPHYHYGHVSTHTQADAIVTDGLVTRDHICAVHYRDLDALGQPRIELLARHATDWEGLAGQLRDPHCHVSPDGRWLSYNRAAGGRSDVYVVRIA